MELGFHFLEQIFFEVSLQITFVLSRPLIPLVGLNKSRWLVDGRHTSLLSVTVRNTTLKEKIYFTVELKIF